MGDLHQPLKLCDRQQLHIGVAGVADRLWPHSMCAAICSLHEQPKVIGPLSRPLRNKLLAGFRTCCWHLCRELREVYAGTCMRAPAAASPPIAEAAAVDFITLEARLGDAPAPVPAASLNAPQYTVVRALTWRRQQLLGLLAEGTPYALNPAEPPAKQPAGLTPTTPGRAGVRLSSGPASGEAPAASACVTSQGSADREGVTLDDARALQWVEASDLAEHCASVLLHQVTPALAGPARIVADVLLMLHHCSICALLLTHTHV